MTATAHPVTEATTTVPSITNGLQLLASARTVAASLLTPFSICIADSNGNVVLIASEFGDRSEFAVSAARGALGITSDSHQRSADAIRSSPEPLATQLEGAIGIAAPGPVATQILDHVLQEPDERVDRLLRQ